jgi:hypothetical protein
MQVLMSMPSPWLARDHTTRANRTESRNRARSMIGCMEGGFGGLFGDPEEMRRRMEELQEQMAGAQRVAWADNAIKLAVDMTVAAIGAIELNGTTDEQATQVRDAIRVVFPEAVTLVREAREGLQ